MPSPNTLRSSAAVAIAACTFAVQAAGADGLHRVQFFPAGEFRSGDVRPGDDVCIVGVGGAGGNAVDAALAAAQSRLAPALIEFAQNVLHALPLPIGFAPSYRLGDGAKSGKANICKICNWIALQIAKW